MSLDRIVEIVFLLGTGFWGGYTYAEHKRYKQNGFVISIIHSYLERVVEVNCIENRSRAHDLKYMTDGRIWSAYKLAEHWAPRNGLLPEPLAAEFLAFELAGRPLHEAIQSLKQRDLAHREKQKNSN